MKFYQGHTVYSPMVLSLYDHVVLGFSNTFIWKCPTKEILALYNRNISENHLDIGVGTGFYLSAAQFPALDPKVTLVDLNQNSLHVAGSRIQKYQPEMVVADVQKDLPLNDIYSSVSLCYLLHCLSGSPEEKCKVFDRVSRVLRNGGRVFGATLVPGLKRETFASQVLMNVYNKIGVFSNREDSSGIITREFQKRFINTSVQYVGSAILFEGSVEKL